MRFIEFIPLCLVFVSTCLAAPSQTINFEGNGEEYSFNYEEPMSSRSESRSSDGMTRGSYSYFDANGQLQTAEYEAGQNLGFNVKATNLPQAPFPVTEAPEILAARQKHLKLLEEAHRQDNNGALHGVNQGFSATPMSQNGEFKQTPSFSGDLLRFQETTGAKDGSMKELNRPVETPSAEQLRLDSPIAGPQLISEANRKVFAFSDFGNEPLPDFPKGSANLPNFLKGSAHLPNLLPGGTNLPNFPQGSTNLPNFPQGSTNFPNFPKGSANLPNFPKGSAHLPNFLQESANVPNYPQGSTNLPNFPQGSTNLPNFPKGSAHLPNFPHGSADLPNFPKGSAHIPMLQQGFNHLPTFPMGDSSFNQFLKENSGFSKTEAAPGPLSSFSPFPKENTNFPSFTKLATDYSPRINFNFSPLLTSNEFSSPQKIETDVMPSPFLKENVNSSSLPKNSADSSLLLNEKSEFMPSNGAFTSVPKSDVASEPLLKTDASSVRFPKENVVSPLLNNGVDHFPVLEGRVNSNPFLKDQVSDNEKVSPTLKSNPNLPEESFSPLLKSETPSTLSEETPKQRDTVAIPSQSENTPETAVLREVQPQLKSSESSVKNTPEDLSSRGANVQIAADPESARFFYEVPKFTPEVQAAREAHFRAHALAAKLAMESDVNPKILELYLGRPGEPKVGSQKIAEIENLLLKGVSDKGIKRLLGNPTMMEAPTKGIDALKENMPMLTDNRGIINLMEKPQLKEILKMPQFQLGTGITPAGTSLKTPDTRVASIDEFQQSKQKAEINLNCGTALKFKDLNDNKSEGDQRLIIVKSGNPAPFLGNVPIPTGQSEQLRNNWAFQYMSV